MNAALLISCVALALAIISLALHAWMLVRRRRTRVFGKLMSRFDAADTQVFLWLWNEGHVNVLVESVTLMAVTATGQTLTSALVRHDREGSELGPNEDALYFLRSVRQIADWSIDYRTACILVRSPAGVVLQLQGPDVASRLEMAVGHVRGVRGVQIGTN